MADFDFHRFIINVEQITGIDLSKYKEEQMKRRLTSLVERHGYADFDSYFQAISQNSILLDELLDRVTINVTEFFRNPSRWEVLEKQILPRLTTQTRKIKTWSAACSSGEEAYTLAMIYHELGIDHEPILGSDLDGKVLTKAKQGLFNERSLQEVSCVLKDKYFSENLSNYKIADHIKKSVCFKKHNLLAEHFDSHYDLIVCRNVMIYFTEKTKEQLYIKFNQALKPGGVLFVGSTEQLFQPEQFGFELESAFFYKKSKTI